MRSLSQCARDICPPMLTAATMADAAKGPVFSLLPAADMVRTAQRLECEIYRHEPFVFIVCSYARTSGLDDHFTCCGNLLCAALTSPGDLLTSWRTSHGSILVPSLPTSPAEVTAG